MDNQAPLGNLESLGIRSQDLLALQERRALLVLQEKLEVQVNLEPTVVQALPDLQVLQALQALQDLMPLWFVQRLRIVGLLNCPVALASILAAQPSSLFKLNAMQGTQQRAVRLFALRDPTSTRGMDQSVAKVLLALQYLMPTVLLLEI